MNEMDGEQMGDGMESGSQTDGNGSSGLLMDQRWTGNGSQMDRNESNGLVMGRRWIGNASEMDWTSSRMMQEVF
jgi:hypothetical protein